MKSYTLTAQIEVTIVTEVEANTFSEAVDIARDRRVFYNNMLCDESENWVIDDVDQYNFKNHERIY